MRALAMADRDDRIARAPDDQHRESLGEVMPVAGVDALTAHADDRAQRGREGGAAVAVGKRRIAASDLDSILWAAEGLLLASSPTDAEAVEARTTFDMLMDGLVAQRWQDVGPTTAELQLKRLVEAFAECAPVETVPASV